MSNFFMRSALIAFALWAVGCAQSRNADTLQAQGSDAFVRVQGNQFFVAGQPYRYVGVNMWYGAYLGSPKADIGDRTRLIKELDFLSAMGVTNIRVLGASEKSILRDAINPAINDRGNIQRDDILLGLDFLLVEMRKRNMRAVIYLNNFWEWSGGMATYLSWVKDGQIVDPSDAATPWPAFPIFTSQFYREPAAIALFHDYVKMITSRVNLISGEAYRDDPTIMAWQLANEPRPGHKSHSTPYLPSYYDWIKKTSDLIKSQAPHQLVSLGSEGTMGCLESVQCVMDSHKETGIDYMTFHLWMKNWGWYDAANPEATFETAQKTARAYIKQHVGFANTLGLPAVLEEFGLERDAGSFDPAVATTYRDDFYALVYDEIERNSAAGGPLVGSNIWAWGGFGKAQHSDYRWRAGDNQFVGDPPQEEQGLNSVYADDTSTIRLMTQHAKNLKR
ncbi:glycoside hydrolase 5 family protein [Marinagarivorans algicola]|uniref:glycoside hydrolase 5 family protein n=1 Tax=Marinagarivorans algicola TaxID=1513270 RepID=UPI0006B4801C|nr:mannanase [Marinagarivorans algicola]